MNRIGAALRRSPRLVAEITFLLGFLGLIANKAQAIPLTDLLDSDPAATVAAGDLLFSNWTLISNDAETDLSQIDVTPLVDRPFGPGLKFMDTGGVLVAEMPDDEEMPGEPPVLASTTSSDVFDITFQYTVSTLDLSLQLDGASLELVDFAINGTGNVDIDETVERTQPFARQVADLSVFAIGIPIPVETLLLDVDSFGPQQSIVVTTNLFGVVEGPGDLARIDSFEQLFSPIPEPASLGLFAAGLVGLGLLSWFGRRVGGAGSEERRI